MIIGLRKKLFIFLFALSYSVFVNAESVVSNDQIAGLWVSDGTSAKIHIYFSGETIVVKAWDSSDGEEFEITNIEWNGEKLIAKFVMPSTQYTTNSTFTLVRPKEMLEVYTGSGSGELTWILEE